MNRSLNILSLLLLALFLIAPSDILIDNSKTTDLVLKGGSYNDVIEEWTPRDLPSVVDWWQSDDTDNITMGAAPNYAVSSWLGSIYGIDLAQGTGANQPFWTADQLNGYPAIVFDGTADYLQGAFGATYSQPNTIILVATEITDDNTTRFMFDGDDGTNRLIFIMVGLDDVYKLNAGASVATTHATGGTGFKIWSLVFNGASSVARVNGVDKSPVGDIGSNDIDGLTLGAKNDGTLRGNTSVTDIIICSTGLTTAELQKVERWLNVHRGGIY